MSRWKWALIVVAIVLVGVIAWRLLARRESAATRGAGASDAPVPVTVVAVEQKDVPVYLSALGTVQALNTVTINAQVSGQLNSINFKEGQEVKAGQLIAQIDPRTFQAALDQAERQEEAGRGAARRAKRTLARYEELIKKNSSRAGLENQRQLVRQQEALVAADDAAISTPGRSSATPGSPRRSTASPASARSTSATSSPRTPAPASSTLTQVHPINVIFNLPEQNLGSVRAPTPTPLPVTALDRTDAHRSPTACSRSSTTRSTRRPARSS